MRRGIIPGWVYKLSKRIINNLHYHGVFDALTQQTLDLRKVNIVVGENCNIFPSAVLITNGNGRIILKGKNRIGRQTELQPGTNGLIKIGYGSSIQDRNIIIGDVEIGRFCLTAPNVFLSSGRHYFEMIPELYIKDQDALVHSDAELSAKHSRKIIIEDDVWIGINAVVMAGITIGRGSIIGSNSVVTKNVPPFSIMAGNPARLLRKRLNFVPKKSIYFENNDDLPNFYKGFLLNNENLIPDRKKGGVSATRSFTVYLDSSGSKIELTLKRLILKPLRMKYFNQVIVIDSPEFATISFTSAHVDYHEFQIEIPEADDDDKIVLVQKVLVID